MPVSLVVITERPPEIVVTETSRNGSLRPLSSYFGVSPAGISGVAGTMFDVPCGAATPGRTAATWAGATAGFADGVGAGGAPPHAASVAQTPPTATTAIDLFIMS